MSRLRLSLATLLAPVLLSTTALAEPHVVTTIKPLHSLVAAVMHGKGEPELLISGAASPHAFSLKPSQARALEKADVVFWIGEGLEETLVKPIASLSANARVVEMAEAEGMWLHPYRKDEDFPSGHHDDHDDHDDHDHAKHDDHGDHDDHDHAKHDDHGDHDDHDHAKHDDHGDHDNHDHAKHDDHGDHDDHGHAHTHDGADMHFWLDPHNAKVMVAQIAKVLSEVDPANANAYGVNAGRMLEELTRLEAEMTEALTPVRNVPYLVFHDAYQYLDKRFELTPVGTVTASPGSLPGAKRVAQMRETVRDTGAKCVFSEPQFDPRLVKVVTEGTDAHRGELDPLGASLEPGYELYFKLLQGMTASLRDCLSH